MQEQRKDIERLGARSLGGWFTSGGVVYAIRVKSGAVKIGWALNHHKRQKELQTGNHELLECILSTHRVEAGMPVAQEMEQMLHRMLRGYRTRGEWFEGVEDAPLRRNWDMAHRTLYARSRYDPKRSGEHVNRFGPCLLCGNFLPAGMTHPCGDCYAGELVLLAA